MNQTAPSSLRTIQAVIKMRDGVGLATTITLPPQDGSFAAVLVRTAYNKQGISGDYFARRGMAFVVQDCRGRYDSEGEFYPFINEENDGLDTLDWIAAQDWCNGHIGMYGDSYLAAVQYAVAGANHPALVALNPRFMPGDIWQSAYYRDGAFCFALSFSWLCLEVGNRVSRAAELPNYDVPAVLRHLPLLTMDERLDCGVMKAYRDYVRHETKDAFWDVGNWRQALQNCAAPLLLTAGWYDFYAGATLEDFQALPPSQKNRVIIGPWTHGVNSTSQLGELDFGPDALLENDASARWLECILSGANAADFQKAALRIFVMGANVWRDEEEWPLQRTQFTPFYLDNNGTLSRVKPATEHRDTYVYDPADPVPTLGGNHSVGPYNPGLYELALPGPYDQKATEERPDVLVYTTDVLETDTEITGPITLKLYASTSAPDTDWVARLCDVYPDGRSINITEGVLRARYRGGQWNAPQLLEPDKTYEYSVKLQDTSNLFKKGHRLRLQITSSNFPLLDRNLNTGEPLATGAAMQVARQTIFCGAGQASQLILPIIPAAGKVTP